MKKVLTLVMIPLMLLCLCGCDVLRDYIFDSRYKSNSDPQGTTASQVTGPTVDTTEPLPPQPEPGDEDPVRVTDYISGILVDLRYSGVNNFTGQQIYEFTDVYLRYGTVKKLKAVSEELEKQGYHLKIWDGFRPVAAQAKLWEVYPDPIYVVNPAKGYSAHSRGNTVDLTLTDRRGNELPMPSGYDEFSTLGDRDYSDCSEEAANNAMILQNAMEQAGFLGYFGEWWHYSDSVSYPMMEDFRPLKAQPGYAVCEDYISLRTGPDVESSVILRIDAGEEMLVLAEYGDFYFVEYRGLRGYVLKEYTGERS